MSSRDLQGREGTHFDIIPLGRIVLGGEVPVDMNQFSVHNVLDYTLLPVEIVLGLESRLFGSGQQGESGI